MALVYKDRVKESISAPIGSADFDFSAASTPTGYQSFVNALADADVVIYGAEDASGNWEVGVGTWTETGTTLARTTILASSNSGSAESFSGTVTVYITNDAALQSSGYHASEVVTPGGRLTLTTGTPVTTSDVTSATNVYYTPYINNKITLWNGNFWETIEFSEVTQALGTISSGKPYDVFAYLSSGALATEILAWTDDTTRATAVTLQDGRYCKSGDKTRLLLGSFYTTSTTTTADAEATRYLSNVYNRVPRTILYASNVASNSWTPGSDTTRYHANSSSHRSYYLAALSDMELFISVAAYMSSSASGYVQFGVGTDAPASPTASDFDTEIQRPAEGGSTETPTVGVGTYLATVGKHYHQMLERVIGTQTGVFKYAKHAGYIRQ